MRLLETALAGQSFFETGLCLPDLIFSLLELQRVSSAMRCERAFRKAVGTSGLDNNLALRDQVLVELIRNLLTGKRSENEALSAGLRHIRHAHRSDG
ncbi:hypothetical protein ASF54_13590 [Frondihabitans sp. Leaf304]|nr:hypothetical protein ASF54_13590 [Frondihabitans sp. Leaf304]